MVSDKAGVSVKRIRILARRHLDPAGATGARERDEILHQSTGGSLPHPIRVHEEVLDLDKGVTRAQPRGETGDGAVMDRRPGASLPDREVGELKDVRVG